MVESSAMVRTAAQPVYDTVKLRPDFIEENVGSFRYRHLIRQLIQRNINTRSKRFYLGVAWSMLIPIIHPESLLQDNGYGWLPLTRFADDFTYRV